MAEAAARPDYHLTVKEWPATERPTERLLSHGPAYLSTAELLAVILRSGTTGETVLSMSEKLLAAYGGLAGLRQATVHELSKQRGLGPVRAAQLKAAIEIAHRLAATDQAPITVANPADVAGLLMLQMSELDVEQLRLVLLNTKNHVVGWPIVYTGGLRTSIVRLSEVFREPIRHGASGIILAHNHPSGDPTPSPEDVKLTHDAVTTGKLLDIDVIDHLVIGRGRWVSLRSLGLGFKNGSPVNARFPPRTHHLGRPPGVCFDVAAPNGAPAIDCMKRLIGFLRREDGAAAVEFAFVAPILVLIVAGLIQVGTLAQTAQLASNAAREGARYAAISDPNAGTYASNYLQNALQGRTDATIGTVTVSSAAVGSAVTVTVPVTVSIAMPVIRNILGSTYQLNGAATMRVTQ